MVKALGVLLVLIAMVIFCIRLEDEDGLLVVAVGLMWAGGLMIVFG